VDCIFSGIDRYECFRTKELVMVQVPLGAVSKVFLNADDADNTDLRGFFIVDF